MNHLKLKFRKRDTNNTDVPAVVMGMINKNGKIEFYSSGHQDVDRNDKNKSKKYF